MSSQNFQLTLEPDLAKGPLYQELSSAQNEMHNQLFGFKELVRTGEPFSQDAIRTIAYGLMETYLLLDHAIEAALPEEIRVVHTAIHAEVARSVAKIKAQCGLH